MVKEHFICLFSVYLMMLVVMQLHGIEYRDDSE